VASFIGSPSMNLLEGKLTEEAGKTYVTTSDMKLRIPEEKAKKVRSYVGKEIWFGIRPEHIQTDETAKDKEDNYVTVETTVVEQMGSEIFAYFTAGTDQQTARLEPEAKVASGKKCKLWFDTTRCHIFDKETEENISL
jgi:multiple sugar transport system ATP-binding protein